MLNFYGFWQFPFLVKMDYLGTKNFFFQFMIKVLLTRQYFQEIKKKNNQKITRNQVVVNICISKATICHTKRMKYPGTSTVDVDKTQQLLTQRLKDEEGRYCMGFSQVTKFFKCS